MLVDVLTGTREAALTCLACLLLVALSPGLWGWPTTVVVSGSMGPSIHVGDVVSAEPHAGRPKVGTVVLVRNPTAEGLLLHRVVDYNARDEMVLKGDANTAKDSTPVPLRLLQGEARLRVPLVGLPFVWIGEGRYGPTGAALVLVLALILWRPRVRRIA